MRLRTSVKFWVHKLFEFKQSTSTAKHCDRHEDTLTFLDSVKTFNPREPQGLYRIGGHYVATIIVPVVSFSYCLIRIQTD